MVGKKPNELFGQPNPVPAEQSIVPSSSYLIYSVCKSGVVKHT